MDACLEKSNDGRDCNGGCGYIVDMRARVIFKEVNLMGMRTKV